MLLLENVSPVLEALGDFYYYYYYYLYFFYYFGHTNNYNTLLHLQFITITSNYRGY